MSIRTSSPSPTSLRIHTTSSPSPTSPPFTPKLGRSPRRRIARPVFSEPSLSFCPSRAVPTWRPACQNGMGAHPSPQQPQRQPSCPNRSITALGKDIYLPRPRQPPTQGVHNGSTTSRTTRKSTREATCANYSEATCPGQGHLPLRQRLLRNSRSPFLTYEHGKG